MFSSLICPSRVRRAGKNGSRARINGRSSGGPSDAAILRDIGYYTNQWQP